MGIYTSRKLTDCNDAFAILLAKEAQSAKVICLTDFMAICVALVGDALPDNVAEDSFNILPVLLNKKIDYPIRESVIHHFR